MNLGQILCALLSTLCTHVTSVETASYGTGQSGTDKKAQVMTGVEGFLADLVGKGIAVVEDDVRKVAGPLIDHIVTAAHAIGAFTHGSSQVQPPSPTPP